MPSDTHDLTNTNDAAAEAEDVRVGIARRKRERMRERLLAATLEVFLNGNGNIAIAEDVMRAAKVSRGTFYKYFNSVDEAASVLGNRLADEAVTELVRVATGRRTPLERAALGAQMLMARAVIQPGWGNFVSRSDHLGQDSAYFSAVRRTTLEARQCGEFIFHSTKAAVDFQIGAVMEGIRRLVGGQPHPRAYMTEVAAMTLKGLGADHARAELAAADASHALTEIGRTHLPWWSDFN